MPYKELTFNEKPSNAQTYSGLRASFLLDGDAKGGILCLASQRDRWAGAKTSQMQVPKEGYFSCEDALVYYEFLKNAGFKIPTVEIKEEHLLYNYVNSDYKTWSEFLATFTAVRYPFYNYPHVKRYVKECIDIHNKYGIPEFEALQLAHYLQPNRDGLHELFDRPSMLLTKEEFQAKDFKTVNGAFYKAAAPLSNHQCTELYNKDIKALYEKLSSTTHEEKEGSASGSK